MLYGIVTATAAGEQTGSRLYDGCCWTGGRNASGGRATTVDCMRVLVEGCVRRKGRRLRERIRIFLDSGRLLT